MGDKLIMSKKELKRKSILDLIKFEQLTQINASKRLGLSYRQTKRIYQRYLKEGDEGLIHKNRGKRSAHALPLEIKKTALALYEEKYWDFGPTLAAEKLLEDDKMKLQAETLRLWLKEAGLWLARRTRKAHRTRRARRSRFGELLQLDGSIHAWFFGVEKKQCLMNLVDDATGKTLSLMDSGETTDAAFRLLKWWIELHGIPMAVYVDLKSVYISPKSLRDTDEDDFVEPDWLTHFSRACAVLGIDVIKAYSAQAKGRVERNHAVYQDRFVKELRLKKITTITGANELLRNGFIDTLNEKFMKLPQSLEDAHIALLAGQKLDDIFCWEYTRSVSNDWIVRFNNQFLQIAKENAIKVHPKQKIVLKKHLDGTITLWHHEKSIAYDVTKPPVKAIKPRLGQDVIKRSQIARKHKSSTPWNRFNPGWLKKIKASAAVTT